MPKADQGVQSDRYMLIPRTLCFIFRGDEVLLIKGAPHKRLWANKYNGVGGHIERGEDVLTAARREVREETGLDIQSLSLCGTVTVDTGDAVGIAIFVFRGEYRGGQIIPSHEGELAWISLDQLEKHPLVEDIPVLLRKVREQNGTGAVFSAHYAYTDDERLVITFG